MPAWPDTVLISANSIATSVIGRCRPVSTLASLIGVASGRVTDEIRTAEMRSPVAPALAAVDAAVALTFRRLGPAAIPVQDRLGIGRYPDDIDSSREPPGGSPDS